MVDGGCLDCIDARLDLRFVCGSLSSWKMFEFEKRRILDVSILWKYLSCRWVKRKEQQVPVFMQTRI